MPHSGPSMICGVRRPFLRRRTAAPTTSTDIMLDLILPHFDGNADPVDFKEVSGSTVILGYFSSQNANAWKSATNATYTVPANKKLVVCYRIGPETFNDASRDARLYNSTDAAEVHKNSNSRAPACVPWSGDLAVASQCPEVAAGKTVVVQIWNSDTNKRSTGVCYVCRLVDA